MYLVSYRQEWIGRDRDGNPEYRYECHWSDGTTTNPHTLPWGRMAGAIDLDTGKVEPKEMVPQ